MLSAVLCALGDDLLLSGVALAPVVNGCEQRRRGLLGGLCLQPQQKTSHPKTELESESGNLLDTFFTFIAIHQLKETMME